MRFIVGIIGIPLGIVIIYFRAKIKDFVGDVGFAEKYLGPGGTYTLIILLGVVVSIGALMYMFGTLQILLEGTVGRLFPGR